MICSRGKIDSYSSCLNHFHFNINKCKKFKRNVLEKKTFNEIKNTVILGFVKNALITAVLWVGWSLPSSLTQRIPLLCNLHSIISRKFTNCEKTTLYYYQLLFWEKEKKRKRTLVVSSFSFKRYNSSNNASILVLDLHFSRSILETMDCLGFEDISVAGSYVAWFKSIVKGLI